MKKCMTAGLLPLLVLLSASASAADAAPFEISGFRFEGASLLGAERLQALVAPFAGKQRGMDDVGRAVAAVKAAYVAAGYPIVQVYAPEQTLGAGTVVLRVSEGKLARVEVRGNKVYSEANVRASLPPLREGEAPNTDAIVAAVLLANDNPARQLAVNFSAGASATEVDARIDVAEDRVGKVSVTLDNAGAAATGRERIGLGYQHANLFGRDHVLSVQLMTSVQQPDKAASVTAGYRIPFYRQGLSLDLVAAYSDSKSNAVSPAGPLFFSGKGVYAGARLNQALASRGEYRHKLVYGIDYKDFNNNCSIAGIELAACGTITDVPLSVSYLGQQATPGYQAGGSIGYFHNLPGGRHGQRERYGTHPRSWQAWRASAYFAQPLGQWQWRATLNAQYSGDALIPSEQFGVGGAASVRGYDERTAAGDRGASANLELYTPELAPRLHLGERHALRALLFYDAGWVRNSDASPIASGHLASVGVGLRYSFDKDVSLRCDAGAAQVATAPGANAPRQSNQGFVHVAFQYAF
ncbi:ShlB/FhaC/HecB family hemolysin secretion/activation protein [Duganella rhizosphaerae]|uniref:ShlB/FhaC/HecB family hemolysin secretion/activation protein n=1 Tax=Duganella rhizosphaerae TaxID=2885763 RepID=UPI00403F7E1F